MIEPFDESSEADTLCSVVVEVSEGDDQHFKYQFHLILDNREYVNLGELRALEAGLKEAHLRLNEIIGKFITEDDE